MKTENLERLIEQLEAYAAFSRPSVHSFLALIGGEPVAECYWWGYAATSHQPMYSVTKSVVSALVGIALGDGLLNLSNTLGEWFPELAPTAPTALITIAHLLTMTGGFTPWGAAAGGDDPLTAGLRRPLAHPPGEQFHYDNEAIDLLVAIVERATGEPAIDFACRRLFAPLGTWQDVPRSHRKRLWKTDRQGRIRGGFGLHLTTRDMAALGQLYLQGGQWQSAQIVPAAYVAASTTAQVQGAYPEFVRYGYLWWVTTDIQGRPAFFASGMGGQFIFVAPALDLIVAITSAKGNGRPHRVSLTRLAMQYAQAEQTG